MDKIIRIGMDTSKHVFQLHGVNAGEKPVLRKKMRRKEMIDFFTTCPPTLVAIEGLEPRTPHSSGQIFPTEFSWVNGPCQRRSTLERCCQLWKTQAPRRSEQNRRPL